MTQLTQQGFDGLDRRRSLETAPAKALYLGTNVELTLGRSIRRRDPARPVMELHPQAVGLYTIGGLLRAVVPAGNGIPTQQLGPIPVRYDAIAARSSPVATTGDFIAGIASVTIASPPAGIVGAVITVQENAVSPGVPSVTWQATIIAQTAPTVFTLSVSWPFATASGVALSLSGSASPYPLDTIKRVTAVESYGFDELTGVHPYLVIERYTVPATPTSPTKFEHHWCVAGPSLTLVATQVALPFQPGPALAKQAGHLWAMDIGGSNVPFSSAVNGPFDWTTPGDAGFLAVLTNTQGSREVTGLGTYNDMVAVIFADSVQLWSVAPDPADNTFIRALNGPGTPFPGTVENVRGDLFYFTRGGFSSLQTQNVSLQQQVVTGEVREQEGVGAAIFDLTQQITDASNGVALWSQRRGAYMCAIGSKLYFLRYSPQVEVMEWSVWDLAGEPSMEGHPTSINYLVELDGIVYFRTEGSNWLYKFDPDSDAEVPFDVQFHFAFGRDRANRKRWDFVEVVQTGECTLTWAVDPRVPTQYAGTTALTDSTTMIDRVFVGALSPALSLRFTGSKPWQLDAWTLTYQPLPW